MSEARAARVLVLVGHGSVPHGYPREKVRRLMQLEGERQMRGGAAGEEEDALDHEIRSWPRTERTDPYKFGLEKLAAALRAQVRDPLLVAYNEFCAPSVPDAVASAVAGGAEEVVLLSSMMTPGGSHSEVEIPALVEELRAKHPKVRIRYAWPFDLDRLAAFMVEHIARFDS